MATVKKSDPVADVPESEGIKTTTIATDDHVASKYVAPKAKAVNDTEFCVYIGPTIHGVIQSGTVYSGTRKATEKALSNAIKKYPLIAKLIVTDKTFAEDRVKVKTPGNALNVFYTKLVSGKSM